MGCRDQSLRGNTDPDLGQVELPHADRKAHKKHKLHADRENRSHVGIRQKPGHGTYQQRRQFPFYRLSQKGMLCYVDQKSVKYDMRFN